MQRYETFIEKIKELLLQCQGRETITLGEIVSTLGYASHYILILFFPIPFLQPIPLPGISLFFGTGIAMSSLCIIFSRKLFVPRSLRTHVFSTKRVEKTTTFLLKMSSKAEKWLHPRGRFMGRHLLLRKINGSLLLIAGLLLALPLPIPFTNTLPAYTITAICLGSIKEDGLFVGIGWLLFSASVLYIFLLTHYSMHLLGSFLIR
jgi:hypothetical protein